MNKGVFLTALSALLYGSIGYFGSKLLGTGIDVYNMLFWRFLISCLILLPFVSIFLFRYKIGARKRVLASFIVLGSTFHGLGTAAYFTSSKRIGTGLAMVLFFTYPIFVVALSYFIKNIAMTRATLFSLCLIILGCTMIANGGDIISGFDLWGFNLALASGLCYGLYVFYSKELNRTLSPILSTFCVCLGSGLMFGFYLLASNISFQWPQTESVWLLYILFALFGTVLPLLLMLAGMKYLQASTASIISVLEPVAVLAVGALVLHEPIYKIQIAGALVILCAAVLVYAKPRIRAL
jgi:drug/metabolite transporter (DMT)-like permease